MAGDNQAQTLKRLSEQSKQSDSLEEEEEEEHDEANKSNSNTTSSSSSSPSFSPCDNNNDRVAGQRDEKSDTKLRRSVALDSRKYDAIRYDRSLSHFTFFLKKSF